MLVGLYKITPDNPCSFIGFMLFSEHFIKIVLWDYIQWKLVAACYLDYKNKPSVPTLLLQVITVDYAVQSFSEANGRPSGTFGLFFTF